MFKLQKTQIILVSCLLFLVSSSVEAITVSPAKIELKADPGSVVDSYMSIFNETASSACFSVGAQKFTESEGRRTFLNDPSLIWEWSELPSKVCLEPGERRQVPFILNVPEDAPPGGHFAVFWWGDVPPEGGAGGVGISVRAGILVYLRVSGEVDETASIIAFSPVKRVIFSLPAEFTYGLENHGNVHLKPKGTIAVRNIFSWTRETVDINTNNLFVLPEGKRVFTEAWTNRGAFSWGPYIATLNLTYGDEAPQQYKKSRLVLFLPWKQSLILFLILLIFGYFLPKFIRRYNEKIIERARKSGHL